MQGLAPEILGHTLFYICVLLLVFYSNHGKTHNMRFTILPALKYAVQWCYEHSHRESWCLCAAECVLGIALLAPIAYSEAV